MVTVTARPGLPAQARLAARVRAALAVISGVVTTAVARAASPRSAALVNLRSMPLSLAGTASIDFSAFHVAHGWGWLVTGASLWIIEHLIADEK